jgi:protein-L-isoaspartate O-methyltransferase
MTLAGIIEHKVSSVVYWNAGKLRYLNDRQRADSRLLPAACGRRLLALRSVPRHAFVPSEHRHLASMPLHLIGQTISQPYIVALMTPLKRRRGKGAEIGTGSGYRRRFSPAWRQVYTVERHVELAAHGSSRKP